MRRTNARVVLALLTVAIIAMAACTGGPTPGGETGGNDQPAELYVYNWTGYIDPEVYAIFEERTGIRVIEDNFSSNEEALAKLQAGGTGYDIIIPSDYMVQIMVEEGLLLPLNKDNLPNIGNVSQWVEDFHGGAPYYDPELTYCVPYLYGTTGLGIGSSVENADEIDSWGYIFDPELNAPFAGRFSMLNDTRELVGAALQYLGYSRNTTNMDELMAARELLLATQERIYAIDSDQFEVLLITGDTILGQAWNGDILLAQEEDPNIRFVIPKEGGTFYNENLCIPVGAPNKDAAEQFINFLLEGDISARLTNYLYYGNPNSAALEFIDPAILNNPAVFPPADVVAVLEPTLDLGETNRVYEDIFSEVISR